MITARRAEPKPRAATRQIDWRRARGALHLRVSFNLGLALLAANFLGHNLGPISSGASNAAALLTLCVLGFANSRFPLRLTGVWLALRGLTAVLLLVAGLTYSHKDFLSLCLAAALVWAIHLLLKGTGGTLRGHSFCAMCVWLYALASLLPLTLPFLGQFIAQNAREWSGVVGRIVEQPLLLGPTGQGWGVLATLLCCLVVVALRNYRKPRFRVSRWLWAFPSLLASNVFCIWVQNQPRVFSQDALTLLGSAFIFLLAGLSVVAGFCFPANVGSGSRLRADSAKARSGRAAPRFRALVFLSLLLVLGVAALTAWPCSRAGRRGGKVLFYDSGYVDWKKPVFGKYGGFESGMFGCLEDYLKPDGFAAEYAPSLTPARLASADVLVIINPTNRWAEGSLNGIWDFVRRGGSLLVLGDHTDILGSQAVLNELLAPAAVRFNFDAGYPAKTEWQNCLELQEHPLCSRIRTASDAIISIGATLDIARPAFALVRGRYGFGDLGNRLNIQGAFLGDYQYEKGEQLGDVVLVAAAHYGKGKVLVFGDTSPFQNGALPFSYPTLVQAVFCWLTAADWPWWVLAKWLGALLALAATLWFIRYASAGVVAVGALLSALAFSVGERLNSHALPAPEPPVQVALLDRSHGERVTLAPFQPDSIGPLSATLQRCGFLPISFNEWSEADIRRAALLVITAPTHLYSRHEINALKSFVEQGGLLLMNSGWEEKGTATEGLLAAFGLDILQLPLGPYPLNRTLNHLPNQPQFINAWPVAVVAPEAQAAFSQARAAYRPPILAETARPPLDSLINNLLGQPGRLESAAAQPPGPPAAIQVLFQTEEGLPLVIARRIGKGAVVLAGDTYFLGHDNLESLRFYRRGNILFLKYVFEQMKRGGS